MRSAGVTTISFLNESGAAAAVTAWGVDGAAVESQQTAALANRDVDGSASSPPAAVLGLTYQVAPVGEAST